jgi:hypothetical protein
MKNPITLEVAKKYIKNRNKRAKTNFIYPPFYFFSQSTQIIDYSFISGIIIENYQANI